MRLALATVVALAALSCRPEAAETRSANLPSDLDRILREARSKVVVPLCKGDVDGYRACGLLVFDFREKAAIDKFGAEHCTALPEGVSCFDLYSDAFMREVRRRYDQANEHDVKVACASEYDCKQWEQHELAWLRSHNDRVLAAAKRQLAARGEQAERDQAEIDNYNRQMRAASAALAGASAGVNREASGCMNSSGCPTGHVCMIPSGATAGSCMKPN